MATNSPPPEPPLASPQRSADPRRRESIPAVQFGMRSLLITISAAAVLLAIGTTVGATSVTTWILAVLASVLTVLMPVSFGTLALYCIGTRRTFFLGAFVGCVLPKVGGLPYFWRDSLAGVAGYVVMSVATSLLSGYVAARTRRYAERRGWTLPAS